MTAASTPQRILIIRPSALGDVCRTVPVLASLRAAYPEAVIDWLVQDTFAPAIAAHPALNATIPFPRGRFARWWRSPVVAREVARWLRALRARRYDLVVDCQGLGRSGFFTWCTGARRRAGSRSARELAWLAYNARHGVEAEAHAVDQMLALLVGEGIEAIDDMRLYVDDADRAWWAEQRDDRSEYVVLAPTARWASKRWPADRWRAFIDRLRDSGSGARSCHLIVIGAPGEESQVDDLSSCDVRNLVGRLSVGQMMAVIEDAALVVAHDSAPLHMAVGFGRPIVALFGPTDPDVVGPYGRRDDVVQVAHDADGDVHYRQRGLGDDLMRRITVDAVVEQAERALSMKVAVNGSAS